MEEFLKLFNARDILFHLINTAILFIAIRFLVYKPVRKFLNARTERVMGEIEGAQAKQAQADEALAVATEKRRAAELAASQIQSEGAARAQQTGDSLIESAKRQAEEILAQARVDAEQTKAAAQAEIQAQALSMAVEIAEKMIGRELAVRDNETLAREFLTKVG